MTVLSMPICFIPAASLDETALIFVMSISLRILAPETAKAITMVWVSRGFLPCLTALAEAVNAALVERNFASAAHGSGGGPPGLCAKATDPSNEKLRTANAICFIDDLFFVARILERLRGNWVL